MIAVVRIRFLCLIIALIGLLMFGSVGYMILEGWGFADGFFMTVVTLSTVGYGETHELSPMGRWFTSGLIFLCFFGMTSWTATLTSFLVDADLGGHLVAKRMKKMISKLKEHTIVCGTSQLAESVIERLSAKREQIVLIDEDESRLEEIRRRFRNVQTVTGSATDEFCLAKGNLLTAKHVVAALPCELDNLLIAITCHDLCGDTVVIAKADDATIANRMRKAGVDQVICPSEICSDKISSVIMGVAEKAGQEQLQTSL